MAQVDSVNWETKRIFLHPDTVTNGFDAWEAVLEVKAIQAANTNVAQNYELPITREGKVSKGGGNFTPRFVFVLTGWRFVPYDQVAHQLDLLVEIVSEEEVSDRDVFDRATLIVTVDIDSVYPQNEIQTVVTGSGVLPADIVAIVDGVFNRVVENGESFEQVLRLVRAEAAGSITVSGLQHRIKSADGLTDRIIANADADGRDVTSTNPN